MNFGYLKTQQFKSLGLDSFALIVCQVIYKESQQSNQKCSEIDQRISLIKA